MDFYVLNQEYKRIGIIDDYKSFIWTPRYYEPGDFELYAPASAELLALLARDNLISRSDDPTHAMIVEAVQIKTSAEDGNFVIASGRCLKSILARRIVWSQTNLAGTVAGGISRLLAENVISPSDTRRRIGGFTIGTMEGGTEPLSMQVTGANLLDAVVGICRTYGLGFDVTIGTSGPTFKLYKGKDRSFAQSILPRVIFSPEYDNLLESSYTEDGTEFKNVAKVAGEGEGTARRYSEAGDAEASGMGRFEVFVDARDISSNNGEIPAEEYDALLQERGIKDLREHDETVGFEGSIQTGMSYKLGTDYDVGDIVEVISDYGIEARARVTEVISCLDETGEHTVPSFESIYTEKEYWVDEEGNHIVDEMRQRFIFK